MLLNYKVSVLNDSFVAALLMVSHDILKAPPHSCGVWIFSTTALFLVFRNLASARSHFSSRTQGMRTYSIAQRRLHEILTPLLEQSPVVDPKKQLPAPQIRYYNEFKSI